MSNYAFFIQPMLYAHILVPVCLLGLLAVLFLIYAGVLWYRKRLEQIETPNVFRYIFISWVLVSPIFTVLYYMVIFQLITFKNTQPNFAEINESMDKLAYKFASLMFINAVGLIYVFVKCISYLAKDCFSHVQIKPIESKESFISFAWNFCQKKNISFNIKLKISTVKELFKKKTFFLVYDRFQLWKEFLIFLFRKIPIW